MELSSLSALSPIDGRYHGKTSELSPYFSEYGLIRYRVRVEIEYFIALSRFGLPELTGIESDQFTALQTIVDDFTQKDAERIKEIEKTTNHDVKAVEYFIKEKFDDLGLAKYKEFIHFGLTSQDINNTAIPLSLKEANDAIILPLLSSLLDNLDNLSEQWKDIPMLAKTHGQPASPTRLGKEFRVFSERLRVQTEALNKSIFPGKFGGATGNMNAHFVAYPENDWHGFAKDFLKKELGLSRSFPTTQIEHYDLLSSYFDNLKRINTILIDLSRDIWQYISMSYFKQKIVAGEIGSSAMPHKVNPIDFENAEGNLGIASAILEHLSSKLPISRLQRDLTDSTVLRNIGTPLAHLLIALKSLQKGLGKIELNEDALNEDLEDNWAVVAEAIQTILRKIGYPEPYEALKALTRKNEKINQETIHEFIHELEVDEDIRAQLLKITPFNYTGK